MCSSTLNGFNGGHLVEVLSNLVNTDAQDSAEGLQIVSRDTPGGQFLNEVFAEQLQVSGKRSF